MDDATTTSADVTTSADATTAAPEAAAAPITDPTSTGAPTEPDQGGTSDQQPGDAQDEFLERFRLSDIEDPQVRAHVEAYVNQAKADYTRKTQTVAEQRREAQAAIDLMSRLESEETRGEALNELLDQFGLEMVDDEAEPNPDEIEETGDPVLDRVARLEHELAAQRAAEAERQQLAQQEAHNERVLAHVDEHLEAFAQELGLDGAEALPDAQRRGVLAIAAAQPLVDGLPNMELAISEWKATVAAGVQDFLRAKDAPSVDASGSSGQSQIDLRNEKDRLAHAEAVAERAQARFA